MSDAPAPSRKRRLVHAAIAIAVGLSTARLALFLLVPDVDVLAHDAPAQTSYMHIRAKERGLAPDAYRSGNVPLEAMSTFIVCDAVFSEDLFFFRHPGMDWHQTRRSLNHWLEGDAKRGGSTITQQLARNLYLSPSRTAWRKLREVFIANAMEKSLEKRRILEVYLNSVEWGDGVWGVEQASRYYFSKKPADLDPFEALVLVGIVPNPRGSFDDEKNRDRFHTLMIRVVTEMRTVGLIDATTFYELLGRLNGLRAELTNGRTLKEVLDARIPMANVTMPSLDEALTTQCGMKKRFGAPSRAQ
jgi:monofunctional glycosyltransferase